MRPRRRLRHLRRAALHVLAVFALMVMGGITHQGATEANERNSYRPLLAVGVGCARPGA